MQRLPDLSLNYLLAGAGGVLIAIAFSSASAIPQQVERDLSRHIGTGSITLEEAITYRQISAQSRMLQNIYLGTAGLVLLAAGVLRAGRSSL